MKIEENILNEGPVTQETISYWLSIMGKNKNLGGHSIFIGQVRDDVKGLKKVIAIEYSAYPEMAKKEAGNIKQEILKEFPDVKDLHILHSTGRVMAGEVSLMVLVSAGHRHQAIDACAKTVELIKGKLPVWKKEIFEDNSHEWVHENPA
ncbi:MAG: molybdenum cofactor biosynthesis protein MoaE [Bacteroidales bacterium]|jgi:molybdopterin synthase catalytic subunit|nr:molybdenum cofactor biosynthesis protein MoaE [Bacteroidales bacterium]